MRRTTPAAFRLEPVEEADERHRLDAELLGKGRLAKAGMTAHEGQGSRLGDRQTEPGVFQRLLKAPTQQSRDIDEDETKRIFGRGCQKLTLQRIIRIPYYKSRWPEKSTRR